MGANLKLAIALESGERGLDTGHQVCHNRITDMISNTIMTKQSQIAYDVIKNDIIRCTLPPGSQVSQPQLVERYHLSMGSIREALQKLEQEGLVQPVARFGYLVAPITLADIYEIYELRLSLETTAVRLACQKGSPAQLEAILQHANFTYQYGDAESYASYLAHNAAFHRAIAAASGNQRLLALMSSLMDDLMRLLHLGLGLRDNAETLRLEHVELAQAIASRDVEKAERLLQQQIEDSQKIILESLARHGTSQHHLLPLGRLNSASGPLFGGEI